MIPKGFQFAGVRCGLKNKRRDLGLIVSDRLCSVAGVFTQNVVRAASVDHTRAAVQRGFLRALVVNSGNANCCTGEQGVRDVLKMTELVAEAVGVPDLEVAVAQTGVIGQLIDMTKVEHGVSEASVSLSEDPAPFLEAILTTDLVEKFAYAAVGDASVYAAGKGSGMVAPNMATMLGFIVTDLKVDAARLDRALRAACDASFNCLTVDGDTSTNDMVLAFANGASDVVPSDEDLDLAMHEVCVSLAKQIARDGEGATKLIEVFVDDARDDAQAKRVAKAIVNSPLVKTAIHGADPNWGRVAMAVGKCWDDRDIDQDSVVIRFGDQEVFPRQVDHAGLARLSDYMRGDTVRIHVSLGVATGSFTVYGCDLGDGYVRINADYTT